MELPALDRSSAPLEWWAELWAAQNGDLTHFNGFMHSKVIASLCDGGGGAEGVVKVVVKVLMVVAIGLGGGRWELI